MKIACLGWGSLIRDPRSLPIRGGWVEDGPRVQAEFARRSQDGRITLVLTDQGTWVRALWSLMAMEGLDAAIAARREREGIPGSRPEFVGAMTRGDAEPDHIAGANDWLQAHGLDAMVWTALPPTFGSTERMPSEQEVLDYLAALRGPRRDTAETYIRRAPPQIDTEYRRAIAAALGWAAVP